MGMAINCKERKRRIKIKEQTRLFFFFSHSGIFVQYTFFVTHVRRRGELLKLKNKWAQILYL